MCLAFITNSNDNNILYLTIDKTLMKLNISLQIFLQAFKDLNIKLKIFF